MHGDWNSCSHCVKLVCQQPFDIIERVMTTHGVRLGDIKPNALRTDDFWLPMFEEQTN